MKPTVNLRRRARAATARLALTVTAATIAAMAAAGAAGAHTHTHARGFFADPNAYRAVSLSYTTSAIRRDHDPTTGALDFIDSQSTSAKLRAGGHTQVSSSNFTAVEVPIMGATNGTMTRYDNQGAVAGTCTYSLALNHHTDALRIVFSRHHGTVGVTLIVVNSEGAYCNATGGDAEALNWYLPSETLPMSAFNGNTVVLRSSGTHVDYPNDPSNNTYQWSLAVTLRRR